MKNAAATTENMGGNKLVEDDVESVSGNEEEEEEIEVEEVDPEAVEDDDDDDEDNGMQNAQDDEDDDEEEEDDGGEEDEEEDDGDDEDYNDGRNNNSSKSFSNELSPAPSLPDSIMNSAQNSPMLSITPPPLPSSTAPMHSSAAAMAGKKSTRPRRSSSTISAPTGGKPKFYSDRRQQQQDQLDNDDGLPIGPQTTEPKKRQQTFGNTNTATAETLLQQSNRPFKNLDISQKLRVTLRAERSTGSKQDAAAAVAAAATATAGSSEQKYNIPAPVAAAPASSSAANAAAPSAAGAEPKKADPVYIRLKPEWLTPHDYEITVEDENWLAQSTHCSAVVSAEMFERLITQFEIYTGAVNAISLTPAKAFAAICQPMSQGAINRQASDELFQYWSSKRNKNKRSLLRRFWIQPTEDNRNATSTFIMREFDNKYKLRKKRMNDLESYEKLMLLKKDFERMHDLAVLMDKRETLKALDVDLIHAEYMEKLATASGGAAIPRPSCLDVPLPECPVLEPMENAYAGYNLDAISSSTPAPVVQQRQRSSSSHKASSSSGAMMASSQAMSEQRKKSHKRKQPGDEGYVSHAAMQPGSGISINPIPFYFPEALYFRDDPVPLPLFLLDDARLLQENPYKPAKLLKMTDAPHQQQPLSNATRLGRNRRMVACPPATTTVQQIGPVEPTLAVRTRINTLLTATAEEEDNIVIERVDLALLRGNEGILPKFQLLV